MTYSVPPPARPRYTERLQKMSPRTDIFFPHASIASVKSIASRLSTNKRKYITRRQGDGVRVWRIA